MKEISDLKSFRDAFVGGISLSLEKEGYQYKKSKEVFTKLNNDHQFSIFIYMYRRAGFIEVETRVYYCNTTIEKKLKEIGIKVLDDKVWGGSIKFISEYYFGAEYPDKYTNLIYEFGEETLPLIQTWLAYLSSIIEPFLKDCTNPVILNKIVNEEKIDTSGLNTSYEKRVLRFYYVGKMAGLSDDELRKLFELYENQLIKLNANYLPKFIEMKNKVIL
ncbi:hypothetical protein [Pedobacter hiemivivus]|uniref:DUF4304 domain-containing protein n=1 Tax=Pedobacter hiemivivus TaxID=2530454 RepID=A0A4R0NGL6_9SPHI|nr:hypothetical protein [Pedobacter hiemivivus]TCC99681.1 hypothetical protein EZ444_03150 [Pedobacter hiemivivus]